MKNNGKAFGMGSKNDFLKSCLKGPPLSATSICAMSQIGTCGKLLCCEGNCVCSPFINSIHGMF